MGKWMQPHHQVLMMQWLERKISKANGFRGLGRGGGGGQKELLPASISESFDLLGQVVHGDSDMQNPNSTYATRLQCGPCWICRMKATRVFPPVALQSGSRCFALLVLVGVADDHQKDPPMETRSSADQFPQLFFMMARGRGRSNASQ